MSWISKSNKSTENSSKNDENEIPTNNETNENSNQRTNNLLEEEEKEDENQEIWKGIGKICLIIYSGSSLLEMDHFLHGQFLLLSERKLFGIMGTQRDKDKKGDCCQYDSTDPPLWFDFTLIDYNNQKEWTHVVEKKGGDFVRLHSDVIDFNTETLKIDEEAKSYIQKFFPKISSLNYNDALVCIGPMSIKVEKIPKDGWIDYQQKIN